MAAKILVVLPDGGEFHANVPVDAEVWSFADGLEFFTGLMRKAFPVEPGIQQKLFFVVERAQGGVMVAVSVEDRRMTVGPFNPSDEGLRGLLDNPEFWIVERKDILLN